MSNASEHFISESSAITTFAVALSKRSCASPNDPAVLPFRC